MLGEYKFAVMALACHYRMDGQEGSAAKLEQEGRELAAKVEPKSMGFAKGKRPGSTESVESVSGTVSQGSQKIQGKHDVPEEESFYRWFVDTRCEILPRSEEIVGQHREDIYALIETCINLCSIAYCQGLAPLMQAAEPLSKSNMQGYKILAYGIKNFCEGNPQDLAERVLRRFPICREDGYTEFTQYLCIRFFLLLQCGAAGRAVETMLLSMIHPKEQNRLKKYLGQTKKWGAMISLPGLKALHLILEKIVNRAAQNADVVVRTRREDVGKVLDLISFLRKKSRAEGFLSLEESISDIKKRNVPYVDFVPEQIIVMIDGMDVHFMAEIMTNIFLVRQPDDFEALVLYLYMVAFLIIWEEFRYSLILYREGAWKELVTIRNEYVRVLPEECKAAFKI